MSEGGQDGQKLPTDQSMKQARFVVPPSGPPEDTLTGQPEASPRETVTRRINLKRVRELLAEKNYREALKETLPEGIDKDEIVKDALPLFEAFAPVLEDEYDKHEKASEAKRTSEGTNLVDLDETSEEKLQNLFNIVLLSGTNPEEAANVLKSLNIDPAQQAAISKQILEKAAALDAEKTSAVPDEPMEPAEAERMTQELNSLKEQMNTGLERMDDIADGEVEPDESEIPKEKLTDNAKEFIHSRVQGLKARAHAYTTITEEWLRVPPSEWGRRLGKTLYVAAVAVFLLVLIEMNLIHKAAAKKR
ncbi:MAG: hypothetical protein ACR2LN_07980 [Candidatus Levyibacteriota bacterium]